ncbi:F-box domain-containing protein [Verticillium alfalfae VaMs.102]|uniref:F-box domain-containing protein n=1 Tax=Verticillium alfalfae (strain VaMs.102 / ATCC MYA-4576 / FGSC 10136) TaxID=526221 RepID=C9SXV9_VERA1|nr:F-box domain-containing protein [Verticillium alfalfae VaMs.102]EEY23624.1 F-box domain-containing protein [Verticillium alfalfae VaMs.102]
MPTLEEIPDEIIHHILSYVSPENNLLSVQLLSRRLNTIANEPLLWRQHCRTSFKYWGPDHDFQAKLDGKVSDVDWKGLFLVRKATNARISNLFDGILATKLGRVRRFEQICLLGYDAKDFLLEQCHTIDTADDVLARRKALLASLRRGLALDVWDSLRRHPDIVASGRDPPWRRPRALESALSALDMFVIQDDAGDMNHVGLWLTAPGAVHELTWCQGMSDPHKNYRNLRNCFIGQALRQEEHESLPLISVAIFCCLAERLGLNAHCLAIPGHVHAVVYATRDTNLDGVKTETGEGNIEPAIDEMYLDPFASDYEVSKDSLRTLVLGVGWQRSLESLLHPAPAATLVVRMATNIKATYTYHRGQDPFLRAGNMLHGHPSENLELAVYAQAWATLLLTPGAPEEFGESSRELAFWFNAHRTEDVWLIEKYYSPLSERILGTSASEFTRPMRREDEESPVPRRRVPDMTFRIGQVVRHARYDRLGLVYGWIQHAGITFYNCMIEDGPPAVVARADNLELVKESRIWLRNRF